MSKRHWNQREKEVKEQLLKHLSEEIEKIFDKTFKSTLYVGIGHWTNETDIEAVNEGLTKLKEEVLAIIKAEQNHTPKTTQSVKQGSEDKGFKSDIAYEEMPLKNLEKNKNEVDCRPSKPQPQGDKTPSTGDNFKKEAGK